MNVRKFVDGKHISNILDKKRFSKRPRYTVVLHEVRDRFDLSLNTYGVIDSIHKLSTSNPNYPYCTMSKDDIGKFLKLGRATVFRSIEEALEKGLIEKNSDSFLRATEKWTNAVEIYDIKSKNK